MTVMPRPITSDELVKLRSVQQRSELYLTAQPAVTVYSARLAAVPTSTDKVVSITYNSGVGTYTNIVQDQTLLVGSTAGGFDLGSVRIRNLTGLGATSGTMNIGQTSGVNWQANAYLTVIDEFQIWRRDPQVLDDGTGTIYMDWDIVYSDQHAHCLSIPVLGPPAVKWLLGATVTVKFDATQSWTLGNTITGYSWVAPGAVSTTGLATANPTMTYNATGMYRVACTITNSDGVSYTGYRYVFIVNHASTAPLLITQFELDSFSGDYHTGGWSAQVTLAAEADLSTIRDRSLIILHTRDWYGPYSSSEGSLGYIDDRENIALVGWVALESDLMGATGRWNTTTFTIHGPGWFLDKPSSYPITLKDKNIPVNKWTRFFGVTAKALMWHIFMWRTTCPRFMDVFPMDNSWRVARLDAAGGLSLWGQINTVLGNHYVGNACADRYGRIHLQRQQNVLDLTTRNSIPVTMTLTRGDWANSINFERRQLDDVGYINFSGVSWDGSKPTAWFSLSPGHTPGQFGLTENPERLALFNDQTVVNTYAAAYRGWKNNPYPKFPFTMPMNNRLIDIAPYQYVINNFVSTDTTRQFTDANHRFIPRTIRYPFNKSMQFFTTELDCEAETPIGLSVTGDTPADPPIIPVTAPPVPTPPPTPVPTPSGNARNAWFATTTAIYWAGVGGGGQPTWNKITVLPGTPDEFNVSQDGSTLYVRSGDTIYKCTNPKAVTPTWTAIAYPGLNTGIGTITLYFSYTLGPMMISGNTLVTTAHTNLFTTQWVYGEYNGTSWTWTNESTANCFSPSQIGYNSWSDCSSKMYDRNHSLLETIPAVDIGSRIWHRQTGPRYYVVSSAGILRLRVVGSQLITIGNNSFTSQVSASLVRGANNGIQVYCVSAGNGADNGALYLSENGTSFTKVFTWQQGWVNDMSLSGGGSLFWFPTSVLSSNELCRISYNRGVTWFQMTGNFWSLTTGNQTLVGCGLSY